jgi:hypothetical protein
MRSIRACAAANRASQAPGSTECTRADATRRGAASLRDGGVVGAQRQLELDARWRRLRRVHGRGGDAVRWPWPSGLSIAAFAESERTLRMFDTAELPAPGLHVLLDAQVVLAAELSRLGEQRQRSASERIGCGPLPPPVMALGRPWATPNDAAHERGGGDRTDSAPPAPRANPPRAEPRISPKPFFRAGAAAAAVMIGVSSRPPPRWRG